MSNIKNFKTFITESTKYDDHWDPSLGAYVRDKYPSEYGGPDDSHDWQIRDALRRYKDLSSVDYKTFYREFSKQVKSTLSYYMDPVTDIDVLIWDTNKAKDSHIEDFKIRNNIKSLKVYFVLFINNYREHEPDLGFMTFINVDGKRVDSGDDFGVYDYITYQKPSSAKDVYSTVKSITYDILERFNKLGLKKSFS